MPVSAWLRHGLLNTLEHGITRVSDALVSLVLLWALAPEVFAKIALAQAAVAPLLLFFVAPETVMYRDFGKWKAEGAQAIAGRVRAFRLFGWGKGQAGLALSAILAWGVPGEGPAGERFAALLWAFALVLAPQVSGGDREFLRLDLRLRELNALSVYQKLVVLGGSAAAVAWFPASPLPALAAVGVFALVSTAALARRTADRALASQGVPAELLRAGRGAPPVAAVLADSLRTFSMWQHLSGIVLNWVQTMDLFFLGVFRLPAREVGLYASVLKLGNLSTALPVAVSNTVVVWMGRRVPDAGSERRTLGRLSLALGGGTLAQAVILAVAAPLLLSLLSHGRWSDPEREAMADWFRWILAGGVLFCSVLLLNFWLAVRTDVSRLFRRVYLPWLAVSAALYAGAVATGGPQAAVLRAARANLAVGIAYVALVGAYYARHARPREGA